MAEYYFLPKKLVRRYPGLQTAAQRLEAGVLGGMLAAIKLLPPRYCASMLGTIFKVFGPFSDKARKADINLQTAFPELGETERKALVRQVFYSLGVATSELLNAGHAWSHNEELIEFVADPETEAILRSGKPAVFVAAHVGAWQYTNLIAAHYGFTLTITYAPESNPAIHDLFYKLRKDLQINLLPSSGSLRTLMKELNAGNSIGLAIDTRPENGDLLPFFGKDAVTNTVAARLALRTKLPLVPVRSERLPGGRYRVTSGPAILASDTEASPTDQALDMSLQLNQVFESWIRATPGEWICLKRRWPKAHKL